MNDFSCPFCQKKFSTPQASGSHKGKCKLNPDYKPPKEKTKAWYEAMAKRRGFGTNQYTKAKLENKKIPEGYWKNKKGNSHTNETKKKLSKIAKNRGLGGYQKGCGIGKKGWYKSFFCDSSWELAFVIYCLDHNIDIKRNKEKRKYIYKNKLYNYIPDFIVNGKVIEIKGYKSERWLCKLKYNPDVIVYCKEEMQKYLNYVIDKYGKNYTDLYE